MAVYIKKIYERENIMIEVLNETINEHDCTSRAGRR